MSRVLRRSKASGGFTLVELVVVVLIIALMGTVAVVSWQSLLPSAQVNAAIRNLSEVLAGTRSEAISRNAVFEVHYNLDEERYWVRTPYRQGGGKATEEDEDRRVLLHNNNLVGDGLEIQQVTIDEETYHDGTVYVRFDPLGASSAHTVVLYHELFETHYTLEILPLTGEIRLHEGVLYQREMPRDGAFD